MYIDWSVHTSFFFCIHRAGYSNMAIFLQVTSEPTHYARHSLCLKPSLLCNDFMGWQWLGRWTVQQRGISLNWNVVFAQWNPVLRQSVYFTKSVSLIKQLHCSSLHCQLSKSSESLVLENYFPKQNKNINECINIKVQRNIKP